MRKLRILIFAGGPVYPIGGMHQVRIINQIRAIAAEHTVDFCFLYTKPENASATLSGLMDCCNEVIPVKTFTQSLFFRLLGKLVIKHIFSRLALPYDHFTLSNSITARLLAKRINQKNYDVVISHYWQASGFIKYLKSNTLRCIDTHYVVEENIDLYKSGQYAHIDDGKLHKLLLKELNLQKRYFEYSDLLIVNSEKQEIILDNNGYENEIACIPNGQDLSNYLRIPINQNLEVFNLLFYGSLSNQFNQKAVSRLLDNIFTIISTENRNIKLIIMGADPPNWLYEKTAGDNNITITGFVEDIGDIFNKCFCCIIPLESGSGFRGRTVELMAAGVPVIGTNNALQSIGITSGLNGIIEESNEELARWVLKLANEPELRLGIAKGGRELAIEKYSLEATHGRLSSLLNQYYKK